MTKRSVILLIILALAVLLKLSFWADQRSVEVQGATRMVAGPGDTLVILTNEEILQVSADGDLLSNRPLKDLGINGPVADLYADADGSMLIGLIETQEILRYSASGERQGKFPRPPSPPRLGVPGQYEQNFKFTGDPGSGTLYVADSNHHRIQIYDSDGRELRTLTAPAVGIPSPPQSGYEAGGRDVTRGRPELDQNRSFRFPNSLIADNGRLYATDTDNHRIVRFRFDGTLDRIIPTVREQGTPFIYPTHFTRIGNELFVINRSELFRDGDTTVLDLDEDASRRLYPKGLPVDPLDIVSVDGEILIADGITRNILRYSPEGMYLGFFGGPELQEVLSQKAGAYRTYTFLRAASLGGLVLVLVGLLLLKRSERSTREKMGLPDVHQPIGMVQSLLGPAGSPRRKLLLILLPGIGQVAAGRILRAVVLLPLLFLPGGALLLLLILLPFGGVQLLPAVAFVAIVTAAVWTGIVLDGLRLTGGAPRKEARS